MRNKLQTVAHLAPKLAAKLPFHVDLRPPIERATCVEDVRTLARRHLPRMVFDFVDGGAEDEAALARNRAAFREALVRPRLCDGRAPDLGVELLGHPLPAPIVLAPAGLASLLHPDGERAVAQAAATARLPYALSAASSTPMEQIVDPHQRLNWFQLYTWRDTQVTDRLIERAQDLGFATLCVTVDVPAYGQRTRDLRRGFSLRPRLTPELIASVARHPRWAARMARNPPRFANFERLAGVDQGHARTLMSESMSAPVSWRQLESIRRRWPGTFVVKGVMHGDDARRCAEIGADAVVVSNHGGRQSDVAPATLTVLAEVVAATPSTCHVLIDGGIRRGSDILSATQAGARAVLIGRPYLYGLAVNGAEGVARVVQLLIDELRRAMLFAGEHTLARSPD